MIVFIFFPSPTSNDFKGEVGCLHYKTKVGSLVLLTEPCDKHKANYSFAFY